ncbi:hypothetical protein Adt_13526 [Abeliophyllum distichum]|uniref:Uncharacterized protein n=1 Tax=Abeliophyllum distichum TaxID=126358 RepID=A0ABD1TX22_9LAMI
MLRKSVVMPKTAMVLSIAGSIIGQIIGSRAERLRLKAKVESKKLEPRADPNAAICGYNSVQLDGKPAGHCSNLGIMWDPHTDKAAKTMSPPGNMCFLISMMRISYNDHMERELIKKSIGLSVRS